MLDDMVIRTNDRSQASRVGYIDRKHEQRGIQAIARVSHPICNSAIVEGRHPWHGVVKATRIIHTERSLGEKSHPFP